MLDFQVIFYYGVTCTGQPGRPGEKGISGLPGPEGKRGFDGRPGKCGQENFVNLPNSVYLPLETQCFILHICKRAQLKKINACFSGEGGMQGPPGPPGQKGEAGVDGIPGSSGDRGDPGLCENNLFVLKVTGFFTILTSIITHTKQYLNHTYITCLQFLQVYLVKVSPDNLA